MTPPPRYRRTERGGWPRPAYRRYLLREASALFILAFALTCIVGLLRLSQGDAAFAAWQAALATPWAVAWHVLVLGFVVWHSITWFRVMPKTAPPLPFDGRWLVAAGLAAALALTLLLWLLLRQGPA
ncbi:MAG: fumarate reductase subunit C [Burkholderiales bacterium]|nr:fumarate reductase subunit C [Burkholderiales bacterium]